VYNSSTGAFLLRNSNNAGAADYGFVFGQPGDIAVAGDWDGDGTDTVGVFRPGTTGTFYLSNRNDQGFAEITFNYGINGDRPLAGDWNSDGVDTIGVFRAGMFYLRNSNTTGTADLEFAFGLSTDLPVAGNWDGQPLMLPPTPTPTSTPGSAPLNASFVYDGDGQRVKSVINNTTTYFVGSHYEVVNGVVTKYYYAGSQRIAMRTNGTLNYLLGDHLGSTSLVTDANGQNPIETRYTAWGEVRYVSGNMPTKYQYTGQFSDSYINLLWYGSRHYDPALGRFTSPDTIVPLASQGVQAWDRYAYVNNSPINYTDPSGHGVDCGIGMGCVSPYTPPNIGRSIPEDTDSDGDGVPNFPDQDYPAIGIGGRYEQSDCTPGNLVECFYNHGVMPEGDYEITFEEFWNLMTAIGLDTDQQPDPYKLDRSAYDTPFFDLGGSNALKSNICVQYVGCFKRQELNYIAQGSWSASEFEGHGINSAVVIGWKLIEYGPGSLPSYKTLQASYIGYNIYTLQHPKTLIASIVLPPVIRNPFSIIKGGYNYYSGQR
jgi:RHS repeat-associated protein